MEKTESKKGDTLLDNNYSPKNSTWLAENLQDTHNTFEQLKRLIEGHENAQVDYTDSSEPKGPQLTSLLQEFYRKYRSLAEHYDLMSGKLQNAMAESVPQSESKEVLNFSLEDDSLQVTPKQTPRPPRSCHHDFSSSGNSSFDISLKEGSESSSLSSDSESESNSSVNSYLGPVKLNKKREHHGVEALYTKENADALQQKNTHGNYQELIAKVAQSEEQLMVLKQKLQQSEAAAKMLKTALDKSESISHDLQTQLEASNAEIEIKIKGSNLELAKAKTLELEKQIVAITLDSDHKTEMLMKELNMAEEKLTRANEDSSSLLAQLDSEKKHAVELQERISGYTDDLCDRESEILELQLAISEEQRKFTVEKEHLLSSHSRLLKKQQEAEAKFNQLKMSVTEKDHQIVEIVAENNGLTARIETLLSELRRRDIQIEELNTGSANAEKLVWELRLRVENLEKEVDLQKVVISDGSEKKKEAIRQLCFSLEHYRSRYHELRQARKSSLLSILCY